MWGRQKSSGIRVVCIGLIFTQKEFVLVPTYMVEELVSFLLYMTDGLL
jgi:hypothetical protein